MSNVKWIKLSTQMFEDEKIKLIEQMPEADTILIIWVKLLSQAGKANANGYIYLSENIPYTDEMLATIFGRPLNTIRLALETFKAFGMIEIDEGNFISIANWEKHQNIEGLDRIREQTRIRQARYRENKRLARGKGDSNATPKKSNVTVTSRNAPEEELELEEELDKERDKEPKRKSRKRVYDENSIHFQLANRLYQRILENNENHKKPNLQNWANDVRLMMERDKRTKDQIIYLIDWCQNDSFWMKNVLSISKLRERFDQLVMQVKSEKKISNPTKPPNYEEVKPNEQSSKGNEQDSSRFGDVQLFK